MTRALANLRLLARDDVGVSSLRGALAMFLVGGGLIGYTVLGHARTGHDMRPADGAQMQRGAPIP